MTDRVYTARCQRYGGWWAISVPELKGIHSQARRLDGVEAAVREAVALYLNVPPNSFSVRVEPILEGRLQRRIGEVHKVRLDAEKLQRQAIRVSTEVAVELVRNEHLTVRDAGRVLGLSHQRVAQLINAPTSAKQRL